MTQLTLKPHTTHQSMDIKFINFFSLGADRFRVDERLDEAAVGRTISYKLNLWLKVTFFLVVRFFCGQRDERLRHTRDVFIWDERELKMEQLIQAFTVNWSIDFFRMPSLCAVVLQRPFHYGRKVDMKKANEVSEKEICVNVIGTREESFAIFELPEGKRLEDSSGNKVFISSITIHNFPSINTTFHRHCTIIFNNFSDATCNTELESK